MKHRLADAGNGRRGVHDFVGEYAGEFFPRLDLAQIDLFPDVFTKLVERFLQSFFSAEHVLGRELKSQVMVAYRLLHDVGTPHERTLMQPEP